MSETWLGHGPTKARDQFMCAEVEESRIERRVNAMITANEGPFERERRKEICVVVQRFSVDGTGRDGRQRTGDVHMLIRSSGVLRIIRW
jgi:hypothetical protein